MLSFKEIFLKKKSNINRTENSIPENVVNEYNKTRIVKDKTLLCHAPFSNLYFNTEGDIALCWKTFHKAEKYDESKSLLDIWNSENFKNIRKNIQDESLSYACQACRKHLQEGNYVNVLSKAYDIDLVQENYPSIIEFELSNRCNLACTMCNGLLSSTIRRERDQLPPLPSPYGEKFVEDLRPFIPHLKEARFNGGEPFSIKIYYQIWDLIFAINPNLKIVVATNGTVLNDKVKKYLSKGNFHINLSVDGIHAQTYESIRIHGNFNQVMDNLDYFQEYCVQNKRTFCLMINPMRNNWHEMPEFVDFCNSKNIHLWFNTIDKPSHLALWSLTARELEHIFQQLSTTSFKSNHLLLSPIQKYNIRTFENFVQQQVKTWWTEAEEREKITSVDDANLDEMLKLISEKLQSKESFEKIELAVNHFENLNQKKIFLRNILEVSNVELSIHLHTLTPHEIYAKSKAHMNYSE